MKSKKPKWTWIIPTLFIILDFITGEPGAVLFTVLAWFVGYWGYDMMEERNRSVKLGFFLGFAFGFVGLLIIYFIPKKKEANENGLDKNIPNTTGRDR